MTNSNNRTRAFADVVTIDAWHDDFADDAHAVDLHADVVFGISRIGGEPDAPVRFRLSVKRAEIIVVVPETEPVTVDRKSVSRDAPGAQGQLTETIEQSTKAHVKASAAAEVGPSGAAGKAEFAVGGEGSYSATKKLEVSATVQFMMVTQSKTADGHYRWTVTPRHSRVLDGRPWDGAKQPRLKLVDKRSDRSKGIPPMVRVEVRCRREDLVIEDIEVKDESVWGSIKSRAGFANRLAAAESYIRDRLSEEGFEVRNIDEIFTEITLGSTTAATN
jgi:hypothetical protein